MRCQNMKTFTGPWYFEYKATLQPMKVQFRGEISWGHHTDTLLCPSGASLSMLSIATAQPPSGGIGIGLNRGGGMQTGLVLRPVVSLLIEVAIERVGLDCECDGSAGRRLLAAVRLGEPLFCTESLDEWFEGIAIIVIKRQNAQ